MNDIGGGKPPRIHINKSQVSSYKLQVEKGEERKKTKTNFTKREGNNYCFNYMKEINKDRKKRERKF